MKMIFAFNSNNHQRSKYCKMLPANVQVQKIKDYGTYLRYCCHPSNDLVILECQGLLAFDLLFRMESCEQ